MLKTARLLVLFLALLGLSACSSEENKPAAAVSAGSGCLVRGLAVWTPDENAAPRPDIGAQAFLFRRATSTTPMDLKDFPAKPAANDQRGIFLVQADAQGRYEFKGISPGAYSLVIVSAAAVRDASAAFEPGADFQARAEALRREADRIGSRGASAEKSLALRKKSLEFANLQLLQDDILAPHFRPDDQARAVVLLGADKRKFTAFPVVLGKDGASLELNANFGAGQP